MASATAVPCFATCNYEQCSNPGVRGRSCASCRQHLCAIHCSTRYHTCSSTSELTDSEWQRAIDNGVEQLLANINVGELIRVAESLNGGKACMFKPGQHSGSGAIMGCANYHAWIIFEEERWLVRIPRGGFSDVPESLIEYLVESEYATLKFLEATKIPTARAFGYGLASDPNNRVGVNYVLMEALSGKPYQASEATEIQRLFVIDQVSEIQAELSRYPFPRAGSLVKSSPGPEFTISHVASNRWVQLGLYGPYDTAEAYYKSIGAQYVDLIADGQLHHDHLREAYLFYHYLYQQATSTLSCGELSQEFFLKHVDDKGDHILVDDCYNITGIIDWQFARVVPAREAFGPSMLTADLQSLYSAHVGLNKHDVIMSKALEQKLPSRLTRVLLGQNELVRRFHFGLASSLYKDEVHGIIAGTLALDPEFRGRSSDQIDVHKWLREQWDACCNDPRRAKVEALLARLEQNKLCEKQECTLHS